MARISLVITSYNQKELLVEAIESGIAQTMRPHEIVIADDCSTDGSQELISAYAREHPNLIKPVLQPSNNGISRNRNLGVQATTGDFATWLDGDDRFCPRKLEAEYDLLRQHPDTAWAYSQVRLMDESGDFKGYRFNTPPAGNIFQSLPDMLGSAPRCLLVRKDVFRELGGFDEEMTLYEDFDFCLRLAKLHNCSYCSEPLSEYRIHTSGLHNRDYESHVENLRRLLEHLTALLDDCPPSERNRLLNALRNRADRLILAKASRQGNIGICFRHYSSILNRSPQGILDTHLSWCMVRALLRRISRQQKNVESQHAASGPQ